MSLFVVIISIASWLAFTSILLTVGFELIRLKRNGTGYVIGENVYRRKYELNGTIHLICRENGCSATAKISGGLATVLKDFHNHDAPDLRALNFRSSVLDKARGPDASKLTLKEIYNVAQGEFLGPPASTSQAARDETIAALPKLHNLRAAIHRAKVEKLPSPPKELKDIDPVHLMHTFKVPDGSSFLLHDSGPTDPNRFLVFGNRDTLKRLSHATFFHVDGTFWVTPSLFYQFLTIHAWIYGELYPVFYVLMPGKSADLYTRVFQQIVAILGSINVQLSHPIRFMSDFEQAIIKSIQIVFPNATHNGCFFHFSQCIFRKVSEMGLRVRYRQDAEFRKAVRCLISLGHVPANLKASYFQILMAHYRHDQDFVRLGNQYFYPTWILGFPLQLWDWHNVSTRTNNHVEGYHAGLKHVFEIPHLSFYRFVDTLFNEEIKNVEPRFRACLLNLPLPPLTQTQEFYKERNESIMQMHQQIGQRLPMDYLTAIARCVPKPHVFPVA